MSTSKDDDGMMWIFIFIFMIFIIIYYCNRWYENSNHHEGFLIEKCWLARDVRAGDGNILYLDGESFHEKKVIHHGHGSYSGYFGEDNADETVYLGNDGDIISLYDFQLRNKHEIEKLGMKFFGHKFYLPCHIIENEDSW